MIPALSAFVLAMSGSLAASIVVKATIAIALGLIAAKVAHGSRAAVRHALLAATFAVLLLLPAVSLVAPPIRIALRTAAQPPPEPILVAVAEAIPPVAPAEAIAVTPRSAGLTLSDLLLSLWIAGMALFLLPVAIGLGRIRSLCRSALAWPEGQAAAGKLALETGVHRRIEVLLHEALPGPMTCGILHPAIVLPQDAELWQAEDLNRAIVHELEHVRRGDWLSLCLARIVCAAYWFHPLVWIAWRKLTLEAERSCDDAVLGRSEPTAYADQLVGLARRLSTLSKSTAKPPLLAMANHADLGTRVNAVLDSGQRRGRAGRFSVALACVAAMALLAMAPLTMVAAPQAAVEAVAHLAVSPLVAQVKTQVNTEVLAQVQVPIQTPVQGQAAPQPTPAQAAPGQVPAQAATRTPHYTSTTRLVIVNVTVADKDGKSLEGLHPYDFQLIEDDKVQAISLFEFQRVQDSVTDRNVSYYIVGYYTPNVSGDGSYRKIRIIVDRPGLAVSTRAGFYSDKSLAGDPQGDDPNAGVDPALPVPIYKPQALYSEEARKAKWQGTVLLSVEVDASGGMRNINVMRSLGLGLDEKAVEAVKVWKFKPGTMGGQPVPVLVEVEMNFRLL